MKTEWTSDIYEAGNDYDQSKKRTIDYFFRINEKTSEKIAYLKSRGIDV